MKKKTSKYQRAIVKFLNREANHSELEQLESWLNDSKKVSTFNKLVKIQYLISISMSEYDVNKAKQSINQKVKRVKRSRRLNWCSGIAIAASFLVLAGLFFSELFNEQKVAVEVPNIIVAGSDKAILTLENGDQVALEKGKSFQKGTLSSDGEQLIYNDENKEAKNKKEVHYNYLTIPKGGQFFVKLSDETKVWLNSESKLKYPTSFHEGEPRKVELLYGEAYFEVSPSSEHKGARFNVVTENQEITVLGTEFNISAYKDDTELVTTLIGGKITVNKGARQKTLVPNQQSRIDKALGELVVLQVDAQREVSWVKGVFAFDEEPLGEMMKVLSRWYDVEVFFISKERKDFIFTGILERTKSLDDIIELIEGTSEGEVHFEIKNKIIFVK